MALDNDAQGTLLADARAPAGTSGSEALQKLSQREVSALHPYMHLTAGAEAADVIEVTAQLRGNAGAASDNVAEQGTFLLQLLDDNAELAAAAAFTAGVTTGTAVSSDTRPAMVIQTDASGTAVVDVTDVAGGSGETVHVLATPLNFGGRPNLLSITFD